MIKVELEIVALSHSILQSHSYAVVLGEVNGLRRLPIVIGSSEAQAIAVAIERMQPSRPLSHDLMKNIMLGFNIELQEVIITDLQEGVFFSKLICTNEYEKIEIDSRTSDAIALAVRFKCPIYTSDDILNAAGLSLKDANAEKEKSPPPPESEPYPTSTIGMNRERLELTQLEERLSQALDQEDYEQAAAIRDEIRRRKS